MANKNKVHQIAEISSDYDDKTDLFHFLADKIAHITVPNMVVLTKGPDVFSTSETSLDSLNIYCISMKSPTKDLCTCQTWLRGG